MVLGRCAKNPTSTEKLLRRTGYSAGGECAHAIATANGVDYLLTWNCLHIANPEIQRAIAEHLEQFGLFLPFICTPEELLGEENAE